MTSTPIDRIANANADALTRSDNAADQIVKGNSDALIKNTKAAEQITKANAEVLAESGNAGIVGLKELAHAYQALAAKNTERLMVSIHALAAVKSPVEFIELQRKLITDSVDAAVRGYTDIARLTAAMFTSTFEPLQKRAEIWPRAVERVS